jgi:uracil-DNA glycosylase family 4
MASDSLAGLNRDIIRCTRCPRLVAFRESIADKKRKQFENWSYWGKPVPGYGDPRAKLLIVGLAPAAHGGNRTGRVFTGDKSAEFLMRCLFHAGLVNQPMSESRDDGLELKNGYMTPLLKCVPPQDKPTTQELQNCFPFFRREVDLLPQVKVLLALGRIAFDGCLRLFREIRPFRLKDYPFRHGACYPGPNGIKLVGAYHPSPRNVNTNRLTFDMMVELLESVKGML